MIYFPNRESLIRDIAEDMSDTAFYYKYVAWIWVLAQGLLTNAQQRAEDEKTP